MRDDHDEFLYEFRQRYDGMLAYQKELWHITLVNKQENPMVSIRAIDSLHRITLDLARVVDVVRQSTKTMKLLSRTIIVSSPIA
jgi:hypothetical protein